MPSSDATERCGTMCPIKLVGRPGILISHVCDECTLRPSGKRIVNGRTATCLFSTSTPSITKMDVAPVSAMACDVAIVNAFRCSDVALPKRVRAVCAIDGRLFPKTASRRFEQLEATTVLSSSSMVEATNGVPSLVTLKQKLLGSKEEVVAETKWLHSFATHTRPFSAPNRQACVGSIVLYIPFVQASHPAASFCCAFARVNVTSWVGLRQSKWHVCELWPSSTSNPQE